MTELSPPSQLSAVPSERRLGLGRRLRRASLVPWLRIVLGGPRGRIGSGLVALTLAIVVFGPAIAPQSPTAISALPLLPPSHEHLLGTDALGRDVLSRFLCGGRSILLLPLVAVAVSGLVGTAAGMWTAYRGALVDGIATRIVDVFFSIPPLLIGMVLVAGLGTSRLVLVAMIVVFFVPRVLRIVRGATQAVLANDYVLAARGRGEPPRAVLAREILPNITGTLLAELAIRLNYAIVWIATFNFLGLGVQPPSSDWGLMISENRGVIEAAPLTVVVPAIGIAALAIGVNFIADEISSHLAHDVILEGRL